MAYSALNFMRRFRKEGDNEAETKRGSAVQALNEATREGQVIVNVREGDSQPVSAYAMHQNINTEKLRKILRFKNYMRTKTLVFIEQWGKGDNTAYHQWLEAQHSGDDEWSLRLVKSAINIPQTAASFKLASDLSTGKTQENPENRQFETITLDHKLTIAEILTKMASFDPFHILNGDATYAAHQDVDESNPHYYRNQGLIRGFAFEEENGMPVETMNGQINSSGIFSDAQRMMVEQAWQISKSRNPIESLFDHVLAPSKSYEKDWDSMLKGLKEACVVSELHRSLRIVLYAYKECTDYNFGYIMDIKTYQKALQNFRHLASKHKSHDFIARTADIIDTAFKIDLLLTQGSSSLNDNFTAQSVLELEKIVNEFHALMCEHGVETSKEQIAASIASGKKPKVGVPSFLWTIERALEQAAQEAKQNALEYSAPSEITKSRPMYG